MMRTPPRGKGGGGIVSANAGGGQNHGGVLQHGVVIGDEPLLVSTPPPPPPAPPTTPASVHNKIPFGPSSNRGAAAGRSRVTNTSSDITLRSVLRIRPLLGSERSERGKECLRVEPLPHPTGGGGSSGGGEGDIPVNTGRVDAAVGGGGGGGDTTRRPSPPAAYNPCHTPTAAERKQQAAVTMRRDESIIPLLHTEAVVDEKKRLLPNTAVLTKPDTSSDSEGGGKKSTPSTWKHAAKSVEKKAKSLASSAVGGGTSGGAGATDPTNSNGNKSSSSGTGSGCGTGGGDETRYRFDSVLGTKTSQRRAYDAVLGRTVVNDALHFRPWTTAEQQQPTSPSQEQHTHVVFSLGVSNSGKSYTLLGRSQDFGGSGSAGGCSSNSLGSLDSSGGGLMIPSDDDGLVPRLCDDLFHTFAVQQQEQDGGVGDDMSDLSTIGSEDSDEMRALKKRLSEEHGGRAAKTRLVLDVAFMEVHNDKVYDLLEGFGSCGEDLQPRQQKSRNAMAAASPSANRKRPGGITTTRTPLRIHQDSDLDTFFVPRLTSHHCATPHDARRLISAGLRSARVSSTSMNETSSRSHTILSIQPLLFDVPASDTIAMDEIQPVATGGKVMIFDLAGIERTKKTAVVGSSLKESIAINSSVGTVLTCLRTLKYNQQQGNGGSKSGGTGNGNKQLIPFRDSKVTMLLQPVLSGRSGQATVTMLVSAYPGENDYAEKRSLLRDVASLRGLTVPNCSPRGVAETPTKPSRSGGGVLSSIMKKSPIRSPLLRSYGKKKQKHAMTSTHIDDIDPVGFSDEGIADPDDMGAIAAPSAPTDVEELLEENANLAKLNAHLKRNCQRLLENNQNLQHQMRSGAGDDQQSKTSTVERERIVADEKRRRAERDNRNNLIPTPLREHILNARATSVVHTGQLHASTTMKTPFELTVPSLWAHPLTHGHERPESQRYITTHQRPADKQLLRRTSSGTTRKADEANIENDDCNHDRRFGGGEGVGKETTNGSRKKLKVVPPHKQRMDYVRASLNN